MDISDIEFKKWMLFFARSRSNNIRHINHINLKNRKPCNKPCDKCLTTSNEGLSFYYNNKQWFLFYGALECLIKNINCIESSLQEFSWQKLLYSPKTSKTGCFGNKVIVFVTSCNIKNLDLVIRHWHMLSKKHVVLFFLNTKKALHWNLKPCLMSRFIVQKNLKKVLLSMYKLGCEGLET